MVFLQQLPLRPPQGYSPSFVQKALPKLQVKISDIKTRYFAKSTSKSPTPNSWMFPALQVSKVQLFLLILNKMLPLGQQLRSARISRNSQGLRALHRFLSILGRKPSHREKPPCCREKITVLDERFATTTPAKTSSRDINPWAVPRGPFP